MTENEFLLQDRLTKIKSVIEKYDENNFYISFSGGKDSTVLSALVDMACPGNTIPRVYANTGIEYRLILEFVEREREREHSWELVILNPTKNIRQMLEEEGYPFKSKSHSRWVDRYNRRGFIDGVKQYLGERDDKDRWSPWKTCPKKLRYQFTDSCKIKISDHCCLRMKEDVLNRYGKEHNRPYSIIALMREEGGRREGAQCLAFKNGKFKNFQPMVIVTKDWEDWFIDEYHIDISDIYKPPYNFPRTGCKGCPFVIHLQKELDILEQYFPEERKQCELIWKPVYDEYRRLGYRLNKPYEPMNKGHQITIEELLGGDIYASEKS